MDGPAGLIPKMPQQMRDEGYAHPIRIMAGTNKDESSYSVLACKSVIQLIILSFFFPGHWCLPIYRGISCKSDAV